MRLTASEQMESQVPPALPPARDFAIDLRGESRKFLRTRSGIIAIGLGLGSAFVGIGIYGLAVAYGSGVAIDLVVSLLLGLLGVSLIVLSLRNGLLNPAIGLRGEDGSFTIERRWRGNVRWRWSDPKFALEFEDLTPDPASSPEERRHMFFTGPGPVYGSLPPAELGPLLDQARAHGLVVRVKSSEVQTGRTYHRIRRVRIAAPKSRAAVGPTEPAPP